jgi:hypothetical protein
LFSASPSAARNIGRRRAAAEVCDHTTLFTLGESLG